MRLSLVDNLFLHKVLAPLTIENFLEQHWEAQPLHIGRADSNHFANLLCTRQIEDLFSTQPLTYPGVQLTQSDRTITAQDYCDDNNRVIALRAMAQYGQGATLVLSHAHNLLHGLAQLCRDTEAALQMPSQANVYLSPASQQGFNPHYDTHDVFILQVSGCKTFSFYSGGAELPLEHQKHDPQQSRAGTKNTEIALQPGDCLYIPRGFVHDAQAHADAPSLHITLGVFPVTVSELLQQLIAMHAERDTNLRRAVPREAWQDNNDRGDAAVSELAAGLAPNLFSTDNIQSALSHLRDNFTLNAKQDCRGLLDMAATHITARDTIALAVNIDLQRNDNQVKLRGQGQILEFAEPLASAIEQLCQSDETTLQSLPGLNDEQRVALGTQLVMSGLFRRMS